MSFLGSLFTTIVGGLFARNSAKSAASAQASAAADLNDVNRKFNHDEAELARQWSAQREDLAYQRDVESATTAFDREMYASNTSHQREVADLRAAGLNPILSANSGASSPSAASISAPIVGSSSASSSSGALASPRQVPDYVGLINSALRARELDLEKRRVDNDTTRANADKQRADNDTTRVSNEGKHLAATLENMKFTQENTKKNTELLQAQIISTIQKTANDKALTSAQINQCNALARQAVLVGEANANYLDNKSAESKQALKAAVRDYNDTKHDFEIKMHSLTPWKVTKFIGETLSNVLPALKGFK